MSVHDPESGSEVALATVVILLLFGAIVIWSMILPASVDAKQLPSLTVQALCAPDPDEYAFSVTLTATPSTSFEAAYDPTFAGSLTFDYGSRGTHRIILLRGGDTLHVRSGTLQASVTASAVLCTAPKVIAPVVPVAALVGRPVTSQPVLQVLPDTAVTP